MPKKLTTQERACRIVRKMRQLLPNESRWTKGAYAVSSTGRSLDEESPVVARMCLVGASNRAAKLCAGGLGNPLSSDWMDAHVLVDSTLAKAVHEVTGEPVLALTTFNDRESTTFEDIEHVLEETHKRLCLGNKPSLDEAQPPMEEVLV